jgi:very-short-patch-repair endonuclease
MSPDALLARLASMQHCVFTAQQALDVGFTHNGIASRVRRGVWIRLFRSVYLMSAIKVDWPQRVMGACLACGPQAVASFAAGLVVWGLRTSVGKPHVSIPQSQKRTCDGVVVHRVTDLERVTWKGFPVTPPMRTLVDAASFGSMKQVEKMLDAADRQDLVDLRRFALYLEGRRGCSDLRRLLRMRNPERAIGSGLETEFLQKVREAGLPLPAPQWAVQTRNGIRYIDFAYPDRMLAIELDSWTDHGTPVALASDRARQNDVEELGWHFRRFTWGQVTHEFDEVETTLRIALGTQ